MARMKEETVFEVDMLEEITALRVSNQTLLLPIKKNVLIVEDSRGNQYIRNERYERFTSGRMCFTIY